MEDRWKETKPTDRRGYGSTSLCFADFVLGRVTVNSSKCFKKILFLREWGEGAACGPVCPTAPPRLRWGGHIRGPLAPHPRTWLMLTPRLLRSLRYLCWIRSRLPNLAILCLGTASWSPSHILMMQKKKKSAQPIKHDLMAICSLSDVADSSE